MVCLPHAHLLCSCENSKKILVFRFSQGDLNELLKRLGMEKIGEKDKAMEISWKSRVTDGGWQLSYLNQHLYNHYGSYQNNDNMNNNNDNIQNKLLTEEKKTFSFQVQEETFQSLRKGEGRRQWGNLTGLKKRGHVTGVKRGRVWLESSLKVKTKKQIR
jgi:hypothetical protein